MVRLRSTQEFKVGGIPAVSSGCFWIYDLRITIYEAFGVVEEFGPGYVLGFPKL